MTLDELALRFKARADDLVRFSPPAAEAFRECALELERFARSHDDETLSREEAASLMGVHPDSISRLIRKGKLRNVGTARRPRIRRADLPARGARPARRTLAVVGRSVPSSPPSADSIARDAIASRMGR
jgi:excisionase family DNA binding protein